MKESDFNTKKAFVRYELNQQKKYRRIKAAENGYDPNYCSSWAKVYTKEEIAEYQVDLNKNKR